MRCLKNSVLSLEEYEKLVEDNAKTVGFFIIKLQIQKINELFEIINNFPNKCAPEKYDDLLKFLDCFAEMQRKLFSDTKNLIKNSCDFMTYNELQKVMNTLNEKTVNPSEWIQMFSSPIEKVPMKSTFSETDCQDTSTMSTQTDFKNTKNMSTQTYAELLKENIAMNISDSSFTNTNSKSKCLNKILNKNAKKPEIIKKK